MNEDKLINEMFNLAKNETPRIAMEQISGSLIDHLNNPIHAQPTRKWWQNLSLNTIIAVTALVGGGIYLLSSTATSIDTNPPARPEQEQLHLWSDTVALNHKQKVSEPHAKSKIPTQVTTRSEESEKHTSPSAATASHQANSSSREYNNYSVEPESSHNTQTNPTPPQEVEAAPASPGQDKSSIEQTTSLPMRAHHCILVRAEGAQSAQEFQKYLESNTPAGMEINFSARSNTTLVRSFSLNINNKNGVDVRIQSKGFHRFELSWQVDQHNKPYGIWYRFDDKAKKPLNLKDHEGSSVIKVKYRSV